MGDTSGKSNAAPPRLELPTGGGAIRGIGEKFAFNAVTGTASVPNWSFRTIPDRGMACSARDGI
jgi:hypothetical protein